MQADNAPEDALVIAEVILRLKNAVADIPRRANSAAGTWRRTVPANDSHSPDAASGCK